MKKFSTLKINVNTYYPGSSKNDYSSHQFANEDGLIQAPERCIENILNFARSYNVAESKSAGKIEMLLN